MERMYLNNFIKVYPSAVEDVWCQSLINDWDNFSRPRKNDPYCRYEMNMNHIRNDSLLCLDMTYETDSDESKVLKMEYYKKVVGMVTKYSQMYNDTELGNALPEQQMTGVQLQKTEADRSGGFYRFHSERLGDEIWPWQPDPMRRMLVWMLYLNDIPIGEGETEFLYQKLRLQPKTGDLVIWPAMFTHTHRGNPVYTTDKYILTGWLSWPEAKVNL
jgi:hypothetical protein|tara:strand:- start:10 stop:657 length:648 start_codon:yes stop_codon:yes gene_type:complete